MYTIHGTGFGDWNSPEAVLDAARYCKFIVSASLFAVSSPNLADFSGNPPKKL